MLPRSSGSEAPQYTEFSYVKISFHIRSGTGAGGSHSPADVIIVCHPLARSREYERGVEGEADSFIATTRAVQNSSESSPPPPSRGELAPVLLVTFKFKHLLPYKPCLLSGEKLSRDATFPPVIIFLLRRLKGKKLAKRSCRLNQGGRKRGRLASSVPSGPRPSTPAAAQDHDAHSRGKRMVASQRG